MALQHHAPFPNMRSPRYTDNLDDDQVDDDDDVTVEYDAAHSQFRRPISSSSPSKPLIRYDANPTYVSLAIQTAFANLDSQIINAPLRILAEHLKQSKDLPDLTQHPMAVASMLPALSGM